MRNLKPLVLAAAAALTVTAHAGDKEVLDLLVKKGVISAEERAKAIQESKTKANELNLNEVYAAQDAVKRLAISGRVQVQYEGASVEENGVASISTNDFILRRMYIGAKADVGEGFSGEIVWNFADGSNGGEFDKAVFTAETSFGKFDIGYQKVQWGQEENTSSGRMAVIERSMVTRYWAESNNGRRVGFGARHAGIHYSNRAILGEGGQGTFNYGLSVVRAEHNANFSGNTAGANDLGFYGFTSVEWKPLGLTVGVNVAENKHSGTSGAVLDVSGYNPYFAWKSGDFTLLGEYIDTDVGTANPTGFNVTGIFKAAEKLEYVIRYSALDTDGRNVRVSDGLRNINGPSTNYNEMDSIYLGVNYYFIGNNAKIQAGYEMANFENAAGTVEGDADIFRVQVQILF
jgi:phosphate-selective porin